MRNYVALLSVASIGDKVKFKGLVVSIGMYFAASILLTASTCYGSLTGDHPKNEGWLPMSAVGYLKSGNEYADKEQYHKAVEAYTKAIDLNPRFFENRAIVYQSLHKDAEAIQDYNTAIDLSPSRLSLYISRGFLYERTGQYDRAMKDFNHVIEKNPMDKNALCYKGDIYFHLGDYQRAIAELSRVIGIDNHFGWAYYSRGMAYYCAEAYKKAILDFKRSIELNRFPEYSRILILLSARKTASDRYDKYRANFHKYVMGTKSNNLARTFLEFFLNATDLSEDDVLSRARKVKDRVEVNDRLCEAYFFLGEYRLLKGDRQGAEDYFRKSRSTNAYDYYEYGASTRMLELLKKGR